MLFEDKKQAAVRILAGGLAGVAAHVLLGYLLGCISLLGPFAFHGFRFPYCSFPDEFEGLGVLLSFTLFALFGAEAGVATLPFAGEGKPLALRSVAHFAAMALTLMVWVLLNFPEEPLTGLLLTFLLPFALVYVLVWLGRWVGWRAEAEQLREKLGLTAGPSPLKWRESLPHIGFAALLCLALPLVLRLLDDPAPVLSVMYAWLLLPIGGVCSGYSLGRRQGFCPLYPAACGLFLLAFILLARLWTNVVDWPLIPVALISTLAGEGLGAFLRWSKQRKETAA